MKRRKFFNPNKMRRRLKRNKRSYLRASNQAQLPKKQKFGLRAARSDAASQGTSLKTKIEIGVLIITLLTTGYLLLFHSFFRLDYMTIEGLERIDDQEFRTAAQGIISNKRFFVIPGDSFFMVDVSEMRDILTARFPVEHMTVQKKFPHALSLTVTERISTVVYDNGTAYSFVDLGGNIVEPIRAVGEDEWIYEKELTTSTDALGEVISEKNIISGIHKPAVRDIRLTVGDYPVIYHIREGEHEINDHVLDKQIITEIIGWYTQLKQTDIPLSYMELDEAGRTLTLHTHEGWSAITTPDISALDGVTQLQDILKQGDVPRPHFSYIDLRIPGRAYWQ